MKALEDVLDYERPDKYIVSDTNYLNEGMPVLTANKSFILGYTNEDFGVYKKLPAIIFDDFTVDSKFVNFSFKVKSSAIKILTPKKKDDLRFIYELISQIDFNATEHKRYYISEYQKLKLPFPSIKEQNKIASCLSSLDDLIEAHSQKLVFLKDHKKGLMQNLFPQEGEKSPKYRFPEFRKDGIWAEKSLDEAATILKGKGISKADIVEDGDLPCIRYGELYTHYNETISTVKSYTNSNPEGLVLSKANDVIIPSSGETQIDIATASCVLESGIALGGDLNIIRSKINGVFLSYYLNNAKRHDIAQMAQGIAVVHLYPNQLKTLQLQIPSPKEQVKIAFCLSSLDEIIAAQTESIEQLKKHKKGLMQGLFPKMND
jgi:type I restriction enzyme S subunit